MSQNNAMIEKVTNFLNSFAFFGKYWFYHMILEDSGAGLNSIGFPLIAIFVIF